MYFLRWVPEILPTDFVSGASKLILRCLIALGMHLLINLQIDLRFNGEKRSHCRIIMFVSKVAKPEWLAFGFIIELIRQAICFATILVVHESLKIDQVLGFSIGIGGAVYFSKALEVNLPFRLCAWYSSHAHELLFAVFLLFGLWVRRTKLEAVKAYIFARKRSLLLFKADQIGIYLQFSSIKIFISAWEWIKTMCK